MLPSINKATELEILHFEKVGIDYHIVAKPIYNQ
jgi:hypothetical protein